MPDFSFGILCVTLNAYKIWYKNAYKSDIIDFFLTEKVNYLLSLLSQ